jgi:hypothetical protein
MEWENRKGSIFGFEETIRIEPYKNHGMDSLNFHSFLLLAVALVFPECHKILAIA